MVGRKTLILAAVVCFGVGLAGALYLAWMVWPTEGGPGDASRLEPAAKEGYLILIAEAYDRDGDLPRARARLAEVVGRDDAVPAAMAALTKQYLDAGQDLRTLRKLVRLTHALGASTTEMLVYLPAERPTPTSTPVGSVGGGMVSDSAARSTPAPTPTKPPAFIYRMITRRLECRTEAGPGRVQVVVKDQWGQDMAGVRLGLAWSSGGEAFFTGLQPEQGEGYADASLREEGPHRLTVLHGVESDIIGDLLANPQASGCPAEARSVVWQVVFQQSMRSPSGG